MSWNYRVMRHMDSELGEYYAIHEVYYDDKDAVEGWTENEVYPFGDTPLELIEDIHKFQTACIAPILDYDTGQEIDYDLAEGIIFN